MGMNFFNAITELLPSIYCSIVILVFLLTEVTLCKYFHIIIFFMR